MLGAELNQTPSSPSESPFSVREPRTLSLGNSLSNPDHPRDIDRAFPDDLLLHGLLLSLLSKLFLNGPNSLSTKVVAPKAGKTANLGIERDLELRPVALHLPIP